MLNNLQYDIQKKKYKKNWCLHKHNKLKLSNKSIYNLYKKMK